jgi:hypothetical protein
MPPTSEKLDGFALRFRVLLERRRQKNTRCWSRESNRGIGQCKMCAETQELTWQSSRCTLNVFQPCQSRWSPGCADQPVGSRAKPVNYTWAMVGVWCTYAHTHNFTCRTAYIHETAEGHDTTRTFEQKCIFLSSWRL